MTFSNPTAHSLPLFFNLKLLKVDDLWYIILQNKRQKITNLTPAKYISLEKKSNGE